MSDETTDAVVVRNDERNRFELRIDEQVVSHASFRSEEDVIVVPHVETPAAHRGQGYAGRLMQGVVEHLLAHDLQLRPLCPYAARYVRERPEIHHVLEARD